MRVSSFYVLKKNQIYESKGSKTTLWLKGILEKLTGRSSASPFCKWSELDKPGLRVGLHFQYFSEILITWDVIILTVDFVGTLFEFYDNK